MNKEESDLIIAEQNKSTEEILKAVAKVKSDYKELCNLKDMRITELEEEIENLKKTYRKQRNKRIDDLQKENAELKDLLQRKEMLLTSAEITAHNEGADKIALLKENAELKKQQFTLKSERNTFLAQNEQYEKDLADFNENLTKAKEIICEYVRLANLEKEDTVAIWQLYHKAEQFLKECK